MVTIQLNSNPLTPDEKALFRGHLDELGLDDHIWRVYEKFLEVSSAYTKPMVARVRRGDELLACMFLMECRDYGSTLSGLKIVKHLARKMSVPVMIWMKAGIAAEISASPAFINRNAGSKDDLMEILDLLRKKYFLLFIHDLKDHAALHPGSVIMPYTDEGIIDTGGYDSIQDYLAAHRNLKKKLKEYRKAGGRVEVMKGQLEDSLIRKIKESVISTGKKSVFQLPYQNEYPDMCAGSAAIDHGNIIHFLCVSDETFYGYHSFIAFKDQIRCLNGAFNRDLPTTHHAYENMICRVVEYAVEHQIQTVYFGPVLNETKRRMMNRFVPTQLFISSNKPRLLRLFLPVLRKTRLNAGDLLKFSGLGRIQ